MDRPHCPLCKKPIAIDAQFCSSCGARAVDPSILSTVAACVKARLVEEITKRFVDQNSVAREIGDIQNEHFVKKSGPLRCLPEVGIKCRPQMAKMHSFAVTGPNWCTIFSLHKQDVRHLYFRTRGHRELTPKQGALSAKAIEKVGRERGGQRGAAPCPLSETKGIV
jgi:hypothetical protein